jgi:hypothetical protein
MNSGNIQSAVGRLQEALDTLQIAWGRTADVWRDDNRRTFEEERLKQVGEEVAAAIPAISNLAQVIQAAQRDLEEQ